MKVNGAFPSYILRFFLLLFFIAALVCEVMSQSAEDVIVMTEKQDGQVISVTKGQIVRIELPALLGAGYSWQFHTTNRRVAALADEPKVLPAGKIGALETQVLEIRILREGTAHLHLDYVRPWDKNARPSKTYRLTVLARNNDSKNRRSEHECVAEPQTE